MVKEEEEDMEEVEGKEALEDMEELEKKEALKEKVEEVLAG